MSSYSIFAFIPLLIAVFSIAGLVLITLGVRGRPMFSSPRCAKCGYDLRNMQFMSSEGVGNCPECGATLAQPGAVSFGRWQRQPRRIVTGVVILILPWVAAFALAAYARSRAMAARTTATGGFVTPQQRAAMPASALVANLSKTINEPWDWQELEARMRRGQLAQADVDAALAALVADMNAKRANGGRREPLHWSGQFVEAVITGGKASPPQVLALTKAFYGTDPRIVMRPRLREGEPIAVVLFDYEPWNLRGMQQVWALSSVVADGATKLSPQSRYPSGPTRRDPPALLPDQLSGKNDDRMEVVIPHALPPGEHEIAFTYEMGVIPENVILRGLDGKPGTPDKWPSPVARWTSVVKQKVAVVPKDQRLLEVVTDPNADPFKSGSIVVEQALVRPALRGAELLLKFKTTGTLAPLVSYRVWIQAGDQKIDYGHLIAGQRTPQHSYNSFNDRKTVKDLPADVKTIDLFFEVNEKVAESDAEIRQIWGKPHAIKGVKLERFDLNPKGDAPATQPG